MVGAAVRGLSKILRKTKTGKKPKRGTPTLAGLAHRRNMLRDDLYPKKKSYLEEIKQPKAKLAKRTKAPKKPGYKTGLVQGVLATAGTAAILSKSKAKKEAKAKKDEDLKKATEEHKKKTKKKRRKYGKPHA